MFDLFHNLKKLRESPREGETQACGMGGQNKRLRGNPSAEPAQTRASRMTFRKDPQ